MMSITKTARKAGRRRLPAALGLALIATLSMSLPSYAQSTDNKPADQKAGGNEKREGVAKRRDQIAETSRSLAGTPAGNQECIWLGHRLLSRLLVDDLDTAFRHLDLYDRFGCPGGHIQAAFRCLVRQGELEPKAPDDAINNRIFACWVNPSMQPAAPASAAAQAPEAGTTTR
jgi:hypothetical protein